MCTKTIFLFSLYIQHIVPNSITEEFISSHGLQEIDNRQNEQKISEYLISILEHWKQEDPVGLPGAPIPDPLSIPPLAHSFSVGTMNFKDIKLFGLSKFRIDHVHADIQTMKVEAALAITTMHVIGNYTLSTWISKANGPFTVNLTKVYVKAISILEVKRSGQLEAQDIMMDIKFNGIEMDFKGLGFFAHMFQGVINSVGTFIFDSIKPFILSEVNSVVRRDVNAQVSNIPNKFPNSISPFDQMIGVLRHKIRDARYDPYKIEDYINRVGIFDVQMTHTWLTGLSTVHRVGDIIFEIKNNTISTLVELGTQELGGSSNWQVSFAAGLVSRVGMVKFSVNYLRVVALLSQTMNTTNPPKLEEIQLKLGNIQVTVDGTGTADYIIEAAVNFVPNLLRFMIMDALESPVKQRVQDVLNTVNIEQIVKENMDKIDDTSAVTQFFDSVQNFNY